MRERDSMAERERDRSKYIEVERQRKGVRGKKRDVERVGERKKPQTTTHVLTSNHDHFNTGGVTFPNCLGHFVSWRILKGH